jgi:hypothetical protein
VLGRNDVSWPTRFELAVHYVAHRSLRLDLEILRRTVRVLATPSGIYNEARGDWGETTDPAGHAEPAKDAPPETV